MSHMMTAKDNGHHNGKSNYTDNGHYRRYRFGNTPEGHLPAAPGKCGGADKKHTCITDQQKIYAVVEQRSPETCFMMYISRPVYKKSHYHCQYTYSDQG